MQTSGNVIISALFDAVSRGSIPIRPVQTIARPLLAGEVGDSEDGRVPEPRFSTEPRQSNANDPGKVGPKA
jgi:hypothetical protein